ncbi:hypothetical protein [Bradyrhizobium sp. Tv2a-2]
MPNIHFPRSIKNKPERITLETERFLRRNTITKCKLNPFFDAR